MAEDLLTIVVRELQARKGTWPQIAEDLKPDVSYSLIAQLGRGRYASAPSYKKLKRLHEYLLPEAAAA